MMLSLDTAYRSFGGEVEASNTPTICRLPDSRRHQLSAIALRTVWFRQCGPSPTGATLESSPINQIQIVRASRLLIRHRPIYRISIERPRPTSPRFSAEPARLHFGVSGHGLLLVLTPLPSFYCWRGGSTAGPSH